MEASPRWGERVEIKNLNSSHNVQLALEHELARQRELVASGKQVARETRHFDEARLLTVPLRAKETEEDYRYVPDPDLPTVPLAPLWERSRAVLPEHPHAVRERWVSGLGVTRESCNVLLANRGFVALQEQLARNEDPRLVFDFLVRDVKGELNYRGTGLEASPLKADGLAAILRGLARDKLTRKAAVEVLRGWLDGGTIDDLLARASGTAAGDDVTHAVRAVLEEERDAMAKLRGGKAGAMNFLVGQAMKRLGGKGRPEDVRREVERQLAAET